jgi:hypothetical protein
VLLARACSYFEKRAGKTQNSKGDTMRSRNQKSAIQVQERNAERAEPRSLEIAKKGIRTGGDFALMMSSLMSDLIEGNVTPQVGNATVNAGGKLLKVVELQLKYGRSNADGTKQRMDLLEVSAE